MPPLFPPVIHRLLILNNFPMVLINSYQRDHETKSMTISREYESYYMIIPNYFWHNNILKNGWLCFKAWDSIISDLFSDTHTFRIQFEYSQTQCVGVAKDNNSAPGLIISLTRMISNQRKRIQYHQPVVITGGL